MARWLQLVDNTAIIYYKNQTVLEHYHILVLCCAIQGWMSVASSQSSGLRRPELSKLIQYKRTRLDREHHATLHRDLSNEDSRQCQAKATESSAMLRSKHAKHSDRLLGEAMSSMGRYRTTFA